MMEKKSDMASPFISLLKEMKENTHKQVQSSDILMKEEFRTSLEQTNTKMTSLNNTVLENSSEIKAIEEWISKTEKNNFHR